MATRWQMIQYAGNAVRIYDKPERTVNSIRWFDTVYVPERTCKNLFSHSDAPRFWCSRCEFKCSMPIHSGIFGVEPFYVSHCPSCGAKVVK